MSHRASEGFSIISSNFYFSYAHTHTCAHTHALSHDAKHIPKHVGKRKFEGQWVKRHRVTVRTWLVRH